MSEHRVKVDGGKYTFVVPADDYRVSILRYGEPWHGPQGEASNALHAIMYELDAARVVVQAARTMMRQSAMSLAGSPIDVALALHDRLVSDREPPSAWCTPTATEPYPAQTWFGTGDDALDREIRMMETEGNLGERWQQGLTWLRELRDRRAAERAEKSRADAIAAQGERDRETYRAFKGIDDALTIEALDALWSKFNASNIGDADRKDARRRYEQRKAWLEMQVSSAATEE